MHDPESVGKKRGSEQSDRYRKSAAQSASGKAHDPESVGKKHDPSASEKSTVRVLREKRGPSVSGKVHDPEFVGKKHGSEQSDRYRKNTAQSIPVKVHSSEYFGKDKNLNRSAASRAVYKENLDRERERYIFLYRQEKYS